MGPILVFFTFLSASTSGGRLFAHAGGSGGTNTTCTCPYSVEDDPVEVPGGTEVSLEKSVSGQLCTLVLLSADNATIAPVARSYDGHDWEAAAGAYSSVKYGCIESETACTAQLPVPDDGGAYILKTLESVSASPTDEVARFLEQGTFGPTRSDIEAFNLSDVPSGIVGWIHSQMYDAEASSHREYFRERANARFPYPSAGTVGRPPHACKASARYRKFAFTLRDYHRNLTVAEDANGQLMLSVEGKFRTFVDNMSFPNIPDAVTPGFYDICRRPINSLGGLGWDGFWLKHTTAGCQPTEYYKDGLWLYGNPPVQADIFAAEVHLLNLSNSLEAVGTDLHTFEGYEPEQEFVLSEGVDHDICNSIPAAEDLSSKPTFGLLPSGDHVIFDPMFVLESNGLNKPLPDGGGLTEHVTGGEAFCSNVPRSFLNEQSCKMSNESTTCGTIDLPKVLPHLLLNLNHSTLRTFYLVGERYVFSVEGLIVNHNSNTDPPCEPGAKSRWIPLNSGSACSTLSVTNETAGVLAVLLESSSDTNPHMREIIFPSSGITCSSADVLETGFFVDVGGICWQHVHQDHLNVFDFTVAKAAPEVQAVISAGGSTVFLPPVDQSINTWNNIRHYFDEVGRLGDDIEFEDLASALQTEPVARAFGAEGMFTNGTGVMVCGSPGEVANNPSQGGSEGRGGFDIAIGGGRDTAQFHTWFRQKKTIWVMLALYATDQLRQRMAWVLSQILVGFGGPRFSINTETFISYHDIFIRNAFGNYFQVLKEVSYSPMMAMFLSYLRSQSTAFIWENEDRIAFADENFAREVMQLFSVGLYKLNLDGTRMSDETGEPIRVYSNEEVLEYARAWTGFDGQPRRGNIEDYQFFYDSATSRIDPMRIELSWRDKLPKMGFDGMYVGDGYPLCADMPSKMFLKTEAKYRLLGISSLPELQEDPSSWSSDTNVQQLSVDPTGELFQKLCNAGLDGKCNFSSVVVLDSNLDCKGGECSVDTVRVVEVLKGVYYEYVRLPCVELAFFNESKKVKSKDDESALCADPRRDVALGACCADTTTTVATRETVYWGERVKHKTAEDRCSYKSAVLCDFSHVSCPDNGCGDSNYFWTNTPCSLKAKVDSEGKVAIVHYTGTSAASNSVQDSTPTFFRVHWTNETYPVPGNNCASGSESNPSLPPTCTIVDGMCLCEVTVSEDIVFDGIPDRDDALSELQYGSFNAAIYDDYTASSLDEVTMYTKTEGVSTSTIFEITDTTGRTRFLKNLQSSAHVLGTSFSFKNPVHFISLVDGEVRDAEFETDAVLEHYLYHDNAAPFLSVRFIQRFGISNPSPRYVEAVATAFRSGSFTWEHPITGEQTGFGSGKYGDLASTVAAVLLDREARSVLLDADPVQGSLREPLLKVIGFMRSMEFKPDADEPLIKLADLELLVGQMVYEFPHVFSFFLPDYQPAGPLTSASLVSPESQLLTGPNSIGFLNGIFSLVRYGLNRCWGGFGNTPGGCYDPFGEYNNAAGNLTYEPTDTSSSDTVVNELSTLLTGGRLGAENIDILKEVFENSDPNEALMIIQQLICSTPEFHTRGGLTKRDNGASRPASEPPVLSSKPYKAVINIFFHGGVDSFNMLVPHSGCSAKDMYAEYADVRGAIALQNDALLPINASSSNQICSIFGLHPQLETLASAYNEGDALFIANAGVLRSPVDKSNYTVGNSAQLFSHDTMQLEGQRVDPHNTVTGTGIIGRLADALTKAEFQTGSISIDSTFAAMVGEPGLSPTPIVVRQSGAQEFDERPQYPEMRQTIDALNNASTLHSSFFGETWSSNLLEDLDLNGVLLQSLDNATLTEAFPNTDFSNQLAMVSKLIQTHGFRGTDRDLFFVEFNGFDHHDSVGPKLDTLLDEVDAALDAFTKEMKAQGRWEDVVVVATSDFGRTLSPNSNLGSDHAWGGNYWLSGGKVEGGQIVGEFPDDLNPSGPLNTGRGRIIPTTGWEAIWNAVARWLGVHASDLDRVLPNRNQCCTHLFAEEELFEAAPVSTTRRFLKRAGKSQK